MFGRTYFSKNHSFLEVRSFHFPNFKKKFGFKPTLWSGLVEESSRSWLLHNTVGLKSWLVIQKSWTNLGFCFDEIGESNLGTKKFKRQSSCIIGCIQLKYIVFLLVGSSFILLWKLFGSRGTIFASAVLRRLCAHKSKTLNVQLLEWAGTFSSKNWSLPQYYPWIH